MSCAWAVGHPDPPCDRASYRVNGIRTRAKKRLRSREEKSIGLVNVANDRNALIDTDGLERFLDLGLWIEQDHLDAVPLGRASARHEHSHSERGNELQRGNVYEGR